MKELNLIAEDTNQYGMDRRDGKGLAQLMRELSKLEGLHWMRILYGYPSYFHDELIEEIATNPKVCEAGRQAYNVHARSLQPECYIVCNGIKVGDHDTPIHL